MNEDKHTRAAAAKASSLLGVGRSEIVATDVSAKFPWLREGAIIWARTRDFKQHCMFWAREDAPLVQLDGKDRLEALSQLLVANVGSLPGNLGAAELAQAIRQLGFEPRGLLAQPELIEDIGDSLGTWLQTDDAHNRQLFHDACTPPVLRAAGDHGWELEFNFFNVRGGVEAWKAAGDHAAIHSAESTELLPDHTFFWPMA